MRRTALALVLTLSGVALGVAATGTLPFFLGAPAGNEVPFDLVALPQPTPSPLAFDLPLPFTFRSPFTPSLHQLLEGEIVITTEKEMREVWRRLFNVPYDASQFDFESSFVVLMGGGVIANGWFAIEAVEQVEASYANPGGPDGDPTTETFLSVTSTTFQSGVQPKDPPPATSWVSAVRISRALLDDVVFRRNIVQGI